MYFKTHFDQQKLKATGKKVKMFLVCSSSISCAKSGGSYISTTKTQPHFRVFIQ